MRRLKSSRFKKKKKDFRVVKHELGLKKVCHGGAFGGSIPPGNLTADEIIAQELS